MPKLGLHLSITGSIDMAFDRAIEKGCTTFQIFSRNPRGWQSKKLVPEEIKLFREKLDKTKIVPIFIHTPYLLNLASPRKRVYQKSVQALKDELLRATLLGIPYVVTHLGSHLGFGKRNGQKLVTDALNSSLSKVQGRVSILLENTAGTKNSVGSYFEDIAHIISGIEAEERIGICFDTCHAFAAGYDLSTSVSIEAVLSRFREKIGLLKLRLVHLNDSKAGLNSRLDRHEHIGLGAIGLVGIKTILRSEFGKHPLILETPNDSLRDDVGNLETVRKLLQEVSKQETS